MMKKWWRVTDISNTCPLHVYVSMKDANMFMFFFFWKYICYLKKSCKKHRFAVLNRCINHSNSKYGWPLKWEIYDIHENIGQDVCCHYLQTVKNVIDMNHRYTTKIYSSLHLLMCNISMQSNYETCTVCKFYKSIPILSILSCHVMWSNWISVKKSEIWISRFKPQ